MGNIFTYLPIFLFFLGAAKFEKEKWHNELNPILNLWKKLNQGSTLLQMKLSAPNEQSSSDPIKSFVQLEFYNGVNLIQSIHKSMASLVKVIRGTQLLDEKVAQLADSLMKQETPSRWQKIWDGPEDPMLYIKVVVEKTNAVQTWNSAVEKGKLLKGKVLSFLEACFDLISSPSLSMKILSWAGKLLEIWG